jgi:hypothetical protein
MKSSYSRVIFLFTAAAAVLYVSFVDGGYGQQIVFQAKVKGSLKDIGYKRTCYTLIRGGKKTKKENARQKSIAKRLILFHHYDLIFFEMVYLYFCYNNA